MISMFYLNKWCDPDKMPRIATFYLGLHCLSEFDNYSKTQVYTFNQICSIITPVCAVYLLYVYLYRNKLYVPRLWINTFSPYPLFLFFPPQINLKIKKWEKQEYTILFSPAN